MSEPEAVICGECGTPALPGAGQCSAPSCNNSWAPGPDFCAECDCIAGNGQRGYHGIYVNVTTWECSFCGHASPPVGPLKAFGISPLERQTLIVSG